MIKSIEETDYYYKLKEVDDDFTFENEDGEEIFSDVSRSVSTLWIGKKWPIEGILFGGFAKYGNTKPVEDERVINQVKDQIEKWSPHNEELAQDVLDSFEIFEERDNLLDLPSGVEAYYTKEKLVLIQKGDEKINPDHDVLWAANSIDILVKLYLILNEESASQSYWHKSKDKPRFPERKPYWSREEEYDISQMDGHMKFVTDLSDTMRRSSYKCVHLQRL